MYQNRTSYSSALDGVLTNMSICIISRRRRHIRRKHFTVGQLGEGGRKKMGGVKFCLFNIRYIDIDQNPTFYVPNISMTRDLLPHELVSHPGSIKCRTSAVKSHRTGRSWYLGESYIEYFCDSIQMGVHRITVVWLSSVLRCPFLSFYKTKRNWIWIRRRGT